MLDLVSIPLPSPTEYRAFVGALQYLSLTRPDISFTVNKLSQFMHKPTTTHWEALKRLFRYLHGTLNHGIFFRRHSPLQLHAFTDADWAGDRPSYRSTTGYIVYLGQNPISWSSKRQSTLARSSTEAEFRVVASTTTEVQWLISLMVELGFKSTVTPTIYCDNLSATHYSANLVFHLRMKHLALDFHFVREKVQDGTIRVTHISGDDQLADALTKPLLRQRFQLLTTKIGLLSRLSILRGHIRTTSVKT
ncbi:putative RNA-directed DNA polymerase [Helianthus annuus]|nr:putative RNA-directed DNA polymerase [Helianthus annuus]KAJ0908879.1 putative RNA-directed DNA polymerase [Helianthus annuus]